jgi:hypothetical protein
VQANLTGKGQQPVCQQTVSKQTVSRRSALRQFARVRSFFQVQTTLIKSRSHRQMREPIIFDLEAPTAAERYDGSSCELRMCA